MSEHTLFLSKSPTQSRASGHNCLWSLGLTSSPVQTVQEDIRNEIIFFKQCKETQVEENVDGEKCKAK